MDLKALNDHTYIEVEDIDVVYDVLKKNKVNTTGEPRKIIINFDGTGGKPSWGIQEKGKKLYGDEYGMANCLKFHLHAGGNVGNSHNEFEDQIPLYYSGVGTRGRIQAVKGLLGFGILECIYKNAYKDLQYVYNEGDELYVFGFSRGAATARLFCSYLENNPPSEGKNWNVKFLGVYDTVVEDLDVGISDSPALLNVKNSVETPGEMPGIVEKAVHLVAIDDFRRAFIPTLFNKDKKNRVTEVWVSGVHSDAGGGYYYDGLSDICLDIMKMQSGLKFREITQDLIDAQPDTLVAPDYSGFTEETKKLFLKYDKDMMVEPCPLDEDIHDTNSPVHSTINFFRRFKHRDIRRIEDGKEMKEEPILLLDAVVERVKDLNVMPPEGFAPKLAYNSNNKYRPQALMGKKYYLVNRKDMTIATEVSGPIETEVDDW